MAINVARSEICTMLLLPAIRRERTSRPSLSVPNGWRRDGGLRRSMTDTATGSYGVIIVPNAAHNSQKATIAPPTTTPGDSFERQPPYGGDDAPRSATEEDITKLRGASEDQA